MKVSGLFVSTHDHDWESGASVGAALYGLAKLTRSEVILEFGTFRGFSALCFAHAIREDIDKGRQPPEACVITCDVEDHKKHDGFDGNPLIQFKIVDSSNSAAVRELYREHVGKCRLVFFDTKHSFDRAKQEFEAISDIVDEDTLILFLDADTGDKRHTVWQLFRDIRSGKYDNDQYRFDAICVPTRWSDDYCLGKRLADEFGRKYSDGIGIIRKEYIRRQSNWSGDVDKPKCTPCEYYWDLSSGGTIRVRNQCEWILYNHIFVDGEYDAAIYRALETTPSDRPMRLVDVGANIGFFTLRAFTLASRSDERSRNCVGLLIEGSPTVFTELTRRFADDATAPHKVQLTHGLVGSLDGLGTIYESDFHIMNSVFPEFHLQSKLSGSMTALPRNAEYVDVTAQCSDWPEIDLLKCDIEGSELLFVENHARVLEKSRLAVFEFHHNWCDVNKCLEKLWDAGFHTQEILRQRPTQSLRLFSK